MRVARRWSSVVLLLIVALLFAVPDSFAQQKNFWDGAIDSLAAKIAAIAGARATVRIDVKNLSSLDGARVADFTAQLEARLGQRGLRVDSGSAGGEAWDVTIAENLRDFVFAATSERDDKSQVVLETLDRGKAAAKSETAARVKLQRELIWSQRERFLDFLVWPSATDGARRLMVLEPRRLVIYRAAADGWQAQESHPLLEVPPQRNPSGILATAKSDAGATLEVHLQGERCTASLEGAMELKCGYDARPMESLDRESVTIGNVCGAEPLALSAGKKDWTQPDTLSVLDDGGDAAASVGNDMSFAGPILELRVGAEEKTVRVIWRDLATGDYEAGIVTATCSD